MSRLILPVLLVFVTLLAQGAELRSVKVFAPPPLHPAVSAGERTRLQVGKAMLMVEEHEAALLDLVGNWVQGQLQPVFRVNGSGQPVDAGGHPTADQTRWVIESYTLVWAGVSLRDEDGIWTTHVIADASVPDKDQRQAWAPDPLIVAGEVYWYDAGQVRIIDIRHGTPFASGDDVQRFQRRDLYSTVYDLARAQGEAAATVVQVADWSLVRGATRQVPVAGLTGAVFGVVTVQRNGFVFAETQIQVDGGASADPYRLQGVALVIPSAIARGDGTVTWSFAREPESRFIAVGTTSATLGTEALPEPQRSQYLALLGAEPQALDVVTEAAEVSTVGGQDTLGLIAGIRAGQAGTEEQRTQALEGREALGSGEAFTVDSRGNVVLRQEERYADPATESIRAATASGLGDGVGLRMQQSLNEEHQLTPEVVEPKASDALALQQAIFQVEAELYPQTPTSLPLRGKAPARFAEMLPAGWMPYYLEGAMVPGDGDNPVEPRPSGIETGAPSYDLDGDGDLDRFLTSDPYENGYNELVVEWHVDERRHRFTGFHNWYWKNNFAVWCGSKGKPETRKLMFVGNDPVLYVEKKDRWTGTNYYSFALTHLFDRLSEPNHYRLALRYIGSAPIIAPPEEPIVPRAETVTWTTTADVDIGGTVVTVPTEQGTETAYLYEELGEDPDLVGETFSEADFVPRATAGKPQVPTKYVRTVTPYTVVGGMAVPGAPRVTVVYFPAMWRETMLEVDPPEPMPSSSNVWMWDYAMGSHGMPYNYRRGYKFPRGSSRGVQINLPEVISRYGGEMPVQPTSVLIDAASIDFTVKEVADDALVLLPVSDDPEDPNRIENDRRTAAWIEARADNHSPRDHRTDRSATETLHGRRTFEIVQGAGFYIYKGQKVHFTSAAEQKALLEKMWLFDMDQPQTVYTVLHQDNDPGKPLLNQARALVDADANALLNPVSGRLNHDLRVDGANENPNVLRRNELKNTIWLFFSAARGREHELEMARYAPKNTRLICVEWDDLNAVQQALPGRDLTFVQSDEVERKLKGEVITKIYGKVNMEGRLDASGKTMGRILDSAAADLALAKPGSYVFLEKDRLYDQPANGVNLCALLDDEQFGSPRSDQWVSNHTMQFRHPMAIWYDDRWSSVVAAYGQNADPRVWCAKWNDYDVPEVGEGADSCRILFEDWATEPRLADLYDAAHAEEYEEAKVGDVTLPERPRAVPEPVAPERPAEWSGGSLEPPLVVEDPGAAPIAPVAPWAGLAGYEALSTEEAIERFLGPEPAVKYDTTKRGWLVVRYSNYAWLGEPNSIGYWIDTGVRVGKWNAASGSDLTPMGNGRGMSARLYGHVLNAKHYERNRTNDQMFLRRLGSDTVIGGSVWGRSFDPVNIAQGEMVMSVYEWNHDSPGEFCGINLVDYIEEHKGHPVKKTASVPQTYASLAHPMTVEYYHYYIKSEVVRRYQMDLLAYQPLLMAWQDADIAYRRYIEDASTYDERLNTYQVWLVDHQAAMVAYEAAMAAHEINRGRYDAYLTQDQAWLAMNADLMEAQDRWQAYLRQRENWVFLVRARIEEPGVLWEESEPTGEAFAAWKNLAEAGPCRN